ncbi:SSI family serine proteinase inhibitor [Actinoallomurus rhizosphaericola]|uniref:SSI family serine proteinase inhibitor n=1 Tax=Actinoallomurus rhizosphaericola TaxID=2952536 RepID=UPI0020910FF1|nr:SSI family serine proteinase inhibitor [Actinoallomurus rhizosphaericola]MCO5993031.1 subtilase-type protease inhibitor [Actinoallomurus rhizosphaericola]
MRIILAFSIAAAIPVVFSVSAAAAQARPAPPAAGSGTDAVRPHAGRHVRPAPPGAVIRDLGTSASGRSPFNERMPPASGIGALGSDATPPQGDAAAPAAPSADPASGQAAAPTLLTLRSAMGSGTPRTVTLQCDPVGGTHPKAAQACADLDKAGNDLTIAPDRKNPRACFMIYSPVTVSAEGQWRGRPVKLTGQYPNTCVLRDKTASIFDF